jgi:ABC-type nitrate/sulfonate/bicarbonate transport system permease component
VAALLRPIPAILSVGALFVAWELYVRLSGVSPTTLPAPTRVLAQLYANRQAVWANTLPTIQATLLGFAVSLTSAFVFSVLIDFARPLRRGLFPVFVISQTLPRVAIAPLVVGWFGLGLRP